MQYAFGAKPLHNAYYVAVPICSCRNHLPSYSAPHFFPPTQNVGLPLQDYGKEPFVVNISEAVKRNNTFRRALWSGNHFQVTLMTIDVGEDVGLELHDDVDQFLYVVEGTGLVQMGSEQHSLNFVRNVSKNDAIIVPAGTWHNLTNVGHTPLKLYSIYAPPEHPAGTAHQTKTEALAAEHE